MNRWGTVESRFKDACWLAPLVPVLVMAMMMFAGNPDAPAILLVYMVLAAGVSSLAMTCLGRPYLNFLRSRGWLNMLLVLPGGAVIGAVAFHLAMLGLGPVLMGQGADLIPDLTELWIGGMFGLIAALSFGLVAGCRWLPWPRRCKAR